MAQLDVSDLVIDPLFVDPLTLIHRVPTVNTLGENTLVETPIATIGSIQPVTGKELQRVPEDLQLADVRTFYIKAEIVTDGASAYPDIIVFGGIRFQVLSTMPWLNYGAGWNSGICVREAAA